MGSMATAVKPGEDAESVSQRLPEASHERHS